jgi:hypothetical protein
VGRRRGAALNGSQAGVTRGEESKGSFGLVEEQRRDKDEADVHVGSENLWAPVGKRLIGNAVRTGTWSDRHWAAGAKQSWAPLYWWAGPFSFFP